MADEVGAQANAAVNSVVENMSKLPASQTAPARKQFRNAPRLFGRERTVHELLGGGKSADALLWRHKPLSAGVLIGATIAYVFFEWSGFTLLSLVSNVLLFLIVILFLWSNAAALLNRAPPPLPELSLSEETVISVASILRVELNKVLAVAHDVALGKDFKLFLKVIAGLWVVSTVGGWFSFLTLLYIGVVLSHTVPLLYEKYEDEIDKYAKMAGDHAHTQYKKFDATVLSKIPRAPAQEKKTQ
ncbi:unnamed protein product [Calypogeia fissa]